jgi:serine/threonine protein phosphatase PrpC
MEPVGKESGILATSRASQTLQLLRDEFADLVPDCALLTAARTHPGRVRARNEDQYLVASLEHRLDIRDTSVGQESRMQRAAPGMVLAVADGVGGVPGGDLASAMAIDALADCALRNLPVLATDALNALGLEEAIEASLRECQVRMRAAANRKGLDERIATTLTLAYVQWPIMHVMHVGDSRAYLVRGGKLVRLTRDQTLAQEIRDSGAIPDRPGFEHVLTSAVGGSSEQLAVEARIVRLERGDKILLCTDGFYRQLPPAQVARMLSSATDQASLEGVLDGLMEDVLLGRAPDNITVVAAVVA